MRVETILVGLETEQYAGQGQPNPTIAQIVESARQVEALGFDGATTAEAGHDPFLPAVLAAEHTRRIYLATNVAIAFPRSPMVTAQLAWDLQHLSGGRFQLGLGTQVKGHNERRYGTPWTAPPGPRLREYVLCLREIFACFQSGKRPGFQGQFYQCTLLPPFFNPGPIEPPPPPIHVAAVNRYMVSLAGELCDGLRLHPIATFRYTAERVLPLLEEGARRAGRDRAEVEVVGAPFLAVGADEEAVQRARQSLRQRIAFYASTRTYHAVLELHGWQDVGLKLHEYSIQGRWAEMPGLITDEMLDEWAVSATYDRLAAEISRRCRGLFDTVMLDVPPDLRKTPDRLGAIVREIRESA